MKTPALAVLGSALFTVQLLAQNAAGGRYSVSGAVLPNGGGHAAGGRYTLAGTAGRFELATGFWTPITVQQVADAPPLAIELLPDGLVRLRWAATEASFVLEGTTDLSAQQWQDFPARPVSDGVEFSVVVPPNGPMRWFRLRSVQ